MHLYIHFVHFVWFSVSDLFSSRFVFAVSYFFFVRFVSSFILLLLYFGWFSWKMAAHVPFSKTAFSFVWYTKTSESSIVESERATTYKSTQAHITLWEKLKQTHTHKHINIPKRIPYRCEYMYIWMIPLSHTTHAIKMEKAQANEQVNTTQKHIHTVYAQGRFFNIPS